MIALALVLSLIGVSYADDPTRITGRVRDLLGKPIAGAKIYVVARSGVEQTLVTDPAGRYQVEVRGPGAYTLIVSSHDVRTGRQITVERGTTATLDLEVPTTEQGEVIEIKGRVRPTVQPKPAFDVQLAAPYSSEAILTDTWTKAWLLLDIDEHGVVTRFKFLKHPGAGLEDIAAHHAFAMKFTPARDREGKPIATYLVWGVEWPSHGWLLERTGSALRIPRSRRNGPPVHLDRNAPRYSQMELVTLDTVPCKGSGPMHLESVYPAYRDCGLPDLARVKTAPWVVRD